MRTDSLALQEQHLAATLAQLRDAQERLAWLFDEARRRPMMDPALRTDAHRVEGCLARLWLVSEFRDGRCHFQSESDSLLVKAAAGLLCEFYSGHTPEEVLQYPPEILNRLGLIRHLTTTRRNGLERVVESIRKFAGAHAPSTKVGVGDKS